MSTTARDDPLPLVIDGRFLGEVVMYRSQVDGAAVVEVTTLDAVGRLRVYVNEGVIFDQDPEQYGPHGECGYMFQDETGESHRCDVVGTHQTHWCMCGVAR